MIFKKKREKDYLISLFPHLTVDFPDQVPEVTLVFPAALGLH
jgi:hypothetical protein